MKKEQVIMCMVCLLWLSILVGFILVGLYRQRVKDEYERLHSPKIHKELNEQRQELIEERGRLTKQMEGNEL